MTIPAKFFVPISHGSSKKPTWSFWKMSVLVVFFLVACFGSPDLDAFSTFAKEYVANISVLSGMIAQDQFLKASQRVFLFQKDFVEDGKKKKRLADAFLFDLLILHLQASADPWHNRIAEILIAHQGKKDICVTFATNGSNFMSHIVMHQDAKMIALAKNLKDFPFSFPRGFGILFNKDCITGVAPFYPKFDNDKEESFLAVKKGGFNVGSFFVKYSGSLAKVLIWEDETGKICWTVMSKNSADSTSASGDSGLNYPRALAAVIAPYMTQDRLQAIYASGVRSFCAEVMLACDNSHGYRAIDGFIVTCAATETHFLGSKELTEWCEEFGLPTDRPLHIEGTEKILAFVQELNKVRDVMTIDVLQAILAKFGLEYDLSKHRAIVQSLVLEGFIITLRNAEGKKLVLKYKFAFYTAVTMFLREYIRSKTNTKPTAKPFIVETEISKFLGRWVFDKSAEMQSLWCWILHQMVHVADTQSFDGPVESWIQASEKVYAGVFAALAANGNDVTKVCELFGCPMLEQQQISLIESTIVLVFGPIGYGKSSFAYHLADSVPNSVHIDGDGNEAWLPKQLVLNLGANRNSETIAAILSAIQAGKNVVFSTGGGAIWIDPKSGQKFLDQQKSFLQLKALEMGIDLKFVVYVPENMEAAYSDSEAVKSTIEDRKARGEKWDVPIQKLCDASSANIQFVKRFMKEAVEVHTYPRFNHDANNFASIAIPQSVTNLMSSNPQTPLELPCLRQHQFVSVLSEKTAPQYSKERREQLVVSKQMSQCKFPAIDPANTLHITISYDYDKTSKLLADPFFPVCSIQTVPLLHCVAKLDDGTLAPFAIINLGRDGKHVTVFSGRFKPESMRAVALAMQAGQSSAMFVPQQGEPQELQFEVLSSQQVQIKAYNVVSHI
jgi:shikimate kinase